MKLIKKRYKNLRFTCQSHLAILSTSVEGLTFGQGKIGVFTPFKDSKNYGNHFYECKPLAEMKVALVLLLPFHVRLLDEPN